MRDIGAALIDIDGVLTVSWEPLVKTGKYLPRALAEASGTPGHVLESFADLPALLGLP
jgi:hypothetical protein